jgi:hypothetical protein
VEYNQVEMIDREVSGLFEMQSGDVSGRTAKIHGNHSQDRCGPDLDKPGNSRMKIEILTATRVAVRCLDSTAALVSPDMASFIFSKSIQHCYT